MPERIFNTLSVDGDDSKLDASLIANMGNNAEFSTVKHAVSVSHIIQTATGNPAYFDNGADNLPMKSVTITITAVQEGDGDPSPGNIRPISGREVVTLNHSDIDTLEPTAYSIDLSTAGTVYGGTLDVISGTLTITHGYLDSYNGEDLPGAWISDRDVYTEGTVPSFGAQVVYELLIPNYYVLTALEIKSIAGVNNVWSDAGDVTCEYCVDVNSYAASEKADYNEQLGALDTRLTDLEQEVEASERRKGIATGYSTTSKALSADYTIIPIGADYIIGSNFSRVSDGGYRANKAGTVAVSAGCFVSGFNTGDLIQACIGKYSGGWQYTSTNHFISANDTSGSCDIIPHIVDVSVGDIIYLRARNTTAARGNVTSARLFIEYI